MKKVTFTSLLGFLVFFANPTIASDGFDNLPNDVQLLSAREAFDRDMAVIAAARNWTVSQAIAQHSVSEALGELTVELAKTRTDIYVGAVLSDQPGGAPSLYIKGVADKPLLDLVHKSGLEVIVFDQQPHSREELVERTWQVHSLLATYGYKQIATSHDIQNRGQIDAAVTTESRSGDVSREIHALLPESLRDSVTLNFTAEPVAIQEYAGGLRLVDGNYNPVCTSGWTVEDSSSSQTGVSTAGHCSNISKIRLYSNYYDTSMQLEHEGVWGDVEWHTTNVVEIPRFYSDSGVSTPVHFAALAHQPTIGQSLCVYGATSGRDCSADIAAFDTNCTFPDGTVVQGLTRMNAWVTAGGDSGAPWFSGIKAYGSHVGLCNGGSVFTPVHDFNGAIGVTVMTY